MTRRSDSLVVMTIGEVAKRSGLRASAIRFYEREGLLPRPARASGQRRYDPGILARLAVLWRAKNCGFTLEEVRKFFNAPGRAGDRWQRAAQKKLVELDATLARIQAMKDLLQRRCQCADIDQCGRRILVGQAAGLSTKPEACDADR